MIGTAAWRDMPRARRSHGSPARVVGVLALCLVTASLTACSGGQRLNVLVSDGSPSLAVMDFRRPLALDPLPDGWRHRTFFRTDPMQISFVAKECRSSIRLATHNSGSMLYRFTDLSLDQYPMLGWDWFVELPIASSVDETTKAGDDHPARAVRSISMGDQAMFSHGWFDREDVALAGYFRVGGHWDPIFSYYQSYYRRQGIDFHARLDSYNNYFTTNANLRPPLNWDAQRRFADEHRGNDLLSTSIITSPIGAT